MLVADQIMLLQERTALCEQCFVEMLQMSNKSTNVV